MKLDQAFYRSFFGRLAPFYDIVDALSLGSTRYQRTLAVRLAGIKPGSVVADLMCGTALNADLALNAGAGKYIGIDSSAEMMDQRAGDERVTFLKADLTSGSTPAVQADHVLCSYGIKCLDREEYVVFADAIDKVLKPGGTVSVLEFRLPANRIFRFFASLYVHLFCGLVCLVLKGHWPPTRDLYRSMTPEIFPDYLASLLSRRGLSVDVIEKPLGSAVLIRGVKPER